MGHNRSTRKSDQLVKNLGYWAIVRREHRIRNQMKMLELVSDEKEKQQIRTRLRLMGVEV